MIRVVTHLKKVAMHFSTPLTDPGIGTTSATFGRINDNRGNGGENPLGWGPVIINPIYTFSGQME